jgi:hypothetical protein
MIHDSAKSEAPLSLLAEIAVTHANIVNANWGYYPEAHVKASISSWLEPYNKPVLFNHDDKGQPLGRIVGSIYKASPVAAKIKNLKRAIDDQNYRGAGYIQNLTNVADSDAVQRVLDGRYDTVSVHGDSSALICSICNQNWLEYGKCNHRFGQEYEMEDGHEALAYWRSGDLMWDELSFVNMPADPFARIVTRQVGGDMKDSVLETYSYKDVTVSDKQVVDTSRGRVSGLFGINNSTGQLAVLSDSRAVDMLDKIYGHRSFAIGMDLSDTNKERSQTLSTETKIADAKIETPAVDAPVTIAAPVVTETAKVEDKKPEATPETTPAEVKPEVKIEDKKPETPKAEATPAVTPAVEPLVTAATAPVVDAKQEIVEDTQAVKDLKKELEDARTETKSLLEKATELQATIKDMKIRKVLDLKEALKLDSFPTEESCKKAIEDYQKRSMESIEDQLKDFEDSSKKAKALKPLSNSASSTDVADAKPLSNQERVDSALSRMTDVQLASLVMSGKLNPPVRK